MTRRPLTDEDLMWAQAGLHARPGQSIHVKDVPASNFFDPPTGTKTKAKPRPRNWNKAFERAVERGRAIMGSGEAPASAPDLVGLYAVLHEHVFEVLPLELQQDYAGAVSSADKLVRDEFAGDYAAAERFVAWCWKQTKQAVKRKKAEGEEPFRPGWRFQFKSRKWLTDYKVARKR